MHNLSVCLSPINLPFRDTLLPYFAMQHILMLVVNLKLYSYVTVNSFVTYDIPLCASDMNKGKVHPCTGTEALYRPYGP
jgi:hypothetical protein